MTLHAHHHMAGPYLAAYAGCPPSVNTQRNGTLAAGPHRQVHFPSYYQFLMAESRRCPLVETSAFDPLRTLSE